MNMAVGQKGPCSSSRLGQLSFDWTSVLEQITPEIACLGGSTRMLAAAAMAGAKAVRELCEASPDSPLGALCQYAQKLIDSHSWLKGAAGGALMWIGATLRDLVPRHGVVRQLRAGGPRRPCRAWDGRRHLLRRDLPELDLGHMGAVGRQAAHVDQGHHRGDRELRLAVPLAQRARGQCPISEWTDPRRDVELSGPGPRPGPALAAAAREAGAGTPPRTRAAVAPAIVYNSAPRRGGQDRRQRP